MGIASLMMLASAAAHAAIDDAKAKELMKSGGCGACHSVKTKIVGPAYADVAAKRKAQPDAVATLTKAVRAGSKGTYGPMPMPATPAARISDADLGDLIAWILTK
jgi:cytochrome c